MAILRLMKGDTTPVIVLTVSGLDLTGKPLEYWVYRRGSDCTPIKLSASLTDAATVMVPLSSELTATAGIYSGHLVITGEQMAVDRQTIIVESPCK